MRGVSSFIRMLMLPMLILAGGCLGTGDPNSDPNTDPNTPAAVQPGDLVDFLNAEIVAGANGVSELRVSGIQPGANVQVVLAPVTYIMQPEYWRIEVRAAALPAGSPPILLLEYSVTLPLNKSVGTKGIEVAGAARTQKIDVALP